MINVKKLSINMKPNLEKIIMRLNETMNNVKYEI